MLSGMAAKGYASSHELPSSSIDSVASLQQKILYSIFDLHFVEADSMLDLLSTRLPGNPEPQYLENYLEFLDALIKGDIGSFQNYQESSGKRIESIKDGKRDHAGSFTALSTIHLQSSVLCAYHNEMFRAAKHLYYSNRYLRQGEETEVGSARKFRNRGILILFGVSAPDEYHWLLKVIGLRGGFDEGMGYLEEYYSFAEGAERLEAYLLFKYAGHTLSSEGTSIADGETYGEHARTLILYSGALEDLSSGNSQGVVDSLGSYFQDPDEREFPYLNLILGEALLNILDPGADISLKLFTEKNESIHYRHYAWHKLSWSYFLKDEWESYQDARLKVINIAEPILDADRQALSEAMDTLPLNKNLLKSRLLFDGGNYTIAIELLGDTAISTLLNKKDSLEFSYRKARIFDRLGENDKAIRNYENVIDEGSGESWYYAPNAALHLGMIYESKGNSEKALELYKKCLKINHSAYKKSIDYKARQGIRRIEELEKLR